MGRWLKVENLEGGSFRSWGTQTPDRSRALPTPRRAIGSPASLVPRPPSVGRFLPSLHPVLGPDQIPVPPPSLPHNSPLALLHAWGHPLRAGCALVHLAVSPPLLFRGSSRGLEWGPALVGNRGASCSDASSPKAPGS